MVTIPINRRFLMLIDDRICITVSFTIYIMAGREIFMKRRQLRAFSQHPRYPLEIENPFTSFKTTEVHITSELAPLPQFNSKGTSRDSQICDGKPTDQGYDRYTVTIASTPCGPKVPMSSSCNVESVALRQHKAAMEVNTAAWGYTKIAVLFFFSLLITWVSTSN